jgi:hypothetical protein
VCASICPDVLPLNLLTGLWRLLSAGIWCCVIKHIYCVKVKLSLCLTNYVLCYEGIWESGCIDPCILDFGTTWRWVDSLMPWLLYPQGKSPWYPLDRRLGASQNLSGQCGQEKNLSLLGLQHLGRPAHSQLLYRLCYVYWCTSSKVLTNISQFTWHHIPGNIYLHSNPCENFKARILTDCLNLVPGDSTPKVGRGIWFFSYQSHYNSYFSQCWNLIFKLS